ncbi:MAG: hypothetical protein ACE5EC_05315 [Phycisphaerae bacterium]
MIRAPAQGDRATNHSAVTAFFDDSGGTAEHQVIFIVQELYGFPRYIVNDQDILLTAYMDKRDTQEVSIIIDHDTAAGNTGGTDGVTEGPSLRQKRTRGQIACQDGKTNTTFHFRFPPKHTRRVGRVG